MMGFPSSQPRVPRARVVAQAPEDGREMAGVHVTSNDTDNRAQPHSTAIVSQVIRLDAQGYARVPPMCDHVPTEAPVVRARPCRFLCEFCLMATSADTASCRLPAAARRSQAIRDPRLPLHIRAHTRAPLRGAVAGAFDGTDLGGTLRVSAEPQRSAGVAGAFDGTDLGGTCGCRRSHSAPQERDRAGVGGATALRRSGTVRVSAEPQRSAGVGQCGCRRSHSAPQERDRAGVGGATALRRSGTVRVSAEPQRSAGAGPCGCRRSTALRRSGRRFRRARS